MLHFYKYYSSFDGTHSRHGDVDAATMPSQSPPIRSAAMVLGQRSGLLYIATSDGVLLVDPVSSTVLGHLTIPSSPSTNASTSLLSSPTALTLSGDGYLYVAANQNRLYRIRTNDIPVVFQPKRYKLPISTKHH